MEMDWCCQISCFHGRNLLVAVIYGRLWGSQDLRLGSQSCDKATRQKQLRFMPCAGVESWRSNRRESWSASAFELTDTLALQPQIES